MKLSNEKLESRGSVDKLKALVATGLAVVALAACSNNEVQGESVPTSSQSSTEQESNLPVSNTTAGISIESSEIGIPSTTVEPVESSPTDPESYQFDPRGYITLRYEIDPNNQEAVNKFADELLSFSDKQLLYCQTMNSDDIENYFLSRVRSGDGSGTQEDIKFCTDMNYLSQEPMNGKLAVTSTRVGDASIELGGDGLPSRVNVSSETDWSMKYLGLEKGTSTTANLELNGKISANSGFDLVSTTDDKTGQKIQAWLMP